MPETPERYAVEVQTLPEDIAGPARMQERRLSSWLTTVGEIPHHADCARPNRLIDISAV
jgi:hypothetical protein